MWATFLCTGCRGRKPNGSGASSNQELLTTSRSGWQRHQCWSARTGKNPWHYKPTPARKDLGPRYSNKGNKENRLSPMPADLCQKPNKIIQRLSSSAWRSSGVSGKCRTRNSANGTLRLSLERAAKTRSQTPSHVSHYRHVKFPTQWTGTIAVGGWLKKTPKAIPNTLSRTAGCTEISCTPWILTILTRATSGKYACPEPGKKGCWRKHTMNRRRVT